MREIKIVKGRRINRGCTAGEALVTTQELSGFGGIDRETGTVIDKRHELCGRSLAGKILVLPGAKGSSSFSMFFHALRLNGVGPKAILYSKTTSKMALGAVVSRVPCMTDFKEDIFSLIRTGDHVVVDADQETVMIIKKTMKTKRKEANDERLFRL